MVNSSQLGVVDSSTGGALLPNPPPAPTPLEGKALLQFIQAYVVGLTGLPGNMVRPRWQAEAPTLPTQGDVWAAVGIASRPADTWPFVGHVTDVASPEGADQLQRHEELKILASFYDMGVDGTADYYASLLRDGLAIAQNREVLSINGMGLGDVGDLISLPSQIKVRWLYRVDLDFSIRRNIVRRYPVLNIIEADVTVIGEEAQGPPIRVPLIIKES